MATVATRKLSVRTHRTSGTWERTLSCGFPLGVVTGVESEREKGTTSTLGGQRPQKNKAEGPQQCLRQSQLHAHEQPSSQCLDTSKDSELTTAPSCPFFHFQTHCEEVPSRGAQGSHALKTCVYRQSPHPHQEPIPSGPATFQHSWPQSCQQRGSRGVGTPEKAAGWVGKGGTRSKGLGWLLSRCLSFTPPLP